MAKVISVNLFGAWGLQRFAKSRSRRREEAEPFQVGVTFLLIHQSGIAKPMKSFFASTILALTLAGSAYADASVKLTDVHLCCQSCVKGVQKAVAKVPGVKAESDMDEKTVSLTAPDNATLQKGVDSLVAAGYYGKSSDAAIKLSSDTGAKDEQVKMLKIEDTHLCCGTSVKAEN